MAAKEFAFMPHAYTEDQLVEQPAIGLLAELGWAVAGSPPGDFYFRPNFFATCFGVIGKRIKICPRILNL